MLLFKNNLFVSRKFFVDSLGKFLDRCIFVYSKTTEHRGIKNDIDEQ